MQTKPKYIHGDYNIIFSILSIQVLFIQDNGTQFKTG